MPNYYHPHTFSVGSVIELSPDESAHALRVMRLEAGETLTLLNGLGERANAVLLPGEPSRRQRQASCRIESVISVPQPRPAISLYVAPPHNKNTDLVLKAATELGVARIVPVICRYAVSKPESPDSWTHVIITAMKQSGNPWLPSLDAPCSFKQALDNCKEDGFFGAVPRPDESNGVFPAPPPSHLALWIGPEGGFAPEEEQALRDKGLRPLTVGPWILRVETAVTALLGVILFQSR